MNRILPIPGAVTTQGDVPVAEANRAQQQRFEQAMRLEQEQKTTRLHGENVPRRSQEQLDQQRLHKKAQQKKNELGIALQYNQMASKTLRQSQLKQPASKEDEPNPFADPSTRLPREQQDELQEKHDKTEQQAIDQKLTTQARLAAEGLPTAAQERARNQKETTPSSTKMGGNTIQQHDPQTAAKPPVPDPLLADGNTAQSARDVRLADAREIAEQLSTESDATKVTDGTPGTNGQSLNPQLKTPGDLQLARMAPAESNRELGQLLERLAVDIYQELGRPERPPLLRLTLPALGELAIRIEHHHGEMQIEILATTQGELLLNQGRSELIDRLQRLHPGERVTLDLFSQPDRDQGSRQQRSIYDEWDADA
ncbi:type III secretion system needle length determinant [Aeromonas sobria]|uniref:type III secretion system needle length determinant n=1 Tax=Aeromonas sobria TaxID=646 RepID=UPI001EFF99BA|nr:type III secretion system needle length determinant [Aeromonas sobria]